MQHEMGMRQDCSVEEVTALNRAMWGIVAELRHLIAPNLQAEYKELTGAQSCPCIINIHLRRHLVECVKLAPKHITSSSSGPITI